MLTITKIDSAVNECKRFLAVAMAAKARMKNDEYAKYGCKETGAIKRASMDLTRVLVSLRDYKL
ncbi:MAG: hypothetical protein U9Q84_01460 [Thermodesulfobacteriota bacterium]|nr:hypothetical protein [Thermodesulfobacteriota bacterium]